MVGDSVDQFLFGSHIQIQHSTYIHTYKYNTYIDSTSERLKTWKNPVLGLALSKLFSLKSTALRQVGELARSVRLRLRLRVPVVHEMEPGWYHLHSSEARPNLPGQVVHPKVRRRRHVKNDEHASLSQELEGCFLVHRFSQIFKHTLIAPCFFFLFLCKAIKVTSNNFGYTTTEIFLLMQLSVSWEDVDTRRYLFFSSLFVLAQDAITYPLDFLRIRQQYDTRRCASSSLWPMTKHIVQREGYRGLFRGFWFSTFSALPGQVMYFGTYEVCKDAMISMHPVFGAARSDLADISMNLVAGFLADTLSVIALCPADVVSQRIVVATQTREHHCKTHTKPKTATAVARAIYHSEGFRGRSC